MQHDYFQKKKVLTFDPTPGVKGVCKDRICACIVLYPLCSIPFNLICDMSTFRKGVCKDRICACMVLYALFHSNLICNMTTFRKKNVLTFDPIPGVEGVCKDRICACRLLHS